MGFVRTGCIMLVLATFAGAGQGMATDIGQVTRERGDSLGIIQQTERELTAGSAVIQHETLRTGLETRLEVTFRDDSRLTLGDASEIILDEMVYDPDSGDGAYVLRVSSGVFRMVSGAINKKGGTLAVVTPVATIGVRGTDFWGLQEVDKLTMALLDDGELEITTPQGTVVLTRPGESVVINRDAPPGDIVVLDSAQIAVAAQTVQF